MNFCDCLCTNLCKEKLAILAANKRDCQNAKKQKVNGAFLQRLTLSEKTFDEMKKRMKAVKKLKVGIGETIEEKTLGSGVLLKKIRVPIGRILFIYESRPEVTIDIAVLSVQSGNKAILRGGSEAKETNKILRRCVENALSGTRLPNDAVQYVEGNRRKLYTLLRKNAFIDLVVARGGQEMVQNILKRSTIPVLAHSEGGARIYIDRSANLDTAYKVVLNAKVSSPAACNSLDTLIIHKDIASILLPKLIKQLKERGVVIFGDERVVKLDNSILAATVKTWEREFLSLSIALKIVQNVGEALAFISRYTNHHSEGIISEDKAIIDSFTKSIDAAALFINCSPRLHDGSVFGQGAEVGIATGKLHVRGPVGLSDLTTYKWVLEGNGQIRE